MIPAQHSEVDISKAKTIGGWMSEQELSFLAERARESKNILEVGTYKGRSARAMADNTDGQITCVDPWDGGYQIFSGDKQKVFQNGGDVEFSLFYSANLTHIKSGKVKFIRKKFKDAFDLLLPQIFDFIFIDALHDYDSVGRDVSLGRLLLSEGGILAGHDYGTWPSVTKAINEIFSFKPAVKVNIVDTIWWVKL